MTKTTQRLKATYICKNPAHENDPPKWEGDRKEDVKEVLCNKRTKHPSKIDEKGNRIAWGCGRRGFVEEIGSVAPLSIHGGDMTELQDLLFPKGEPQTAQRPSSDGSRVKKSHRSDKVKVGSFMSVGMINLLHQMFFKMLKIDTSEIPKEMMDELNASAMTWIATLGIEASPKMAYLSNLITVVSYSWIRSFDISSLWGKKDEEEEKPKDDVNNVAK